VYAFMASGPGCSGNVWSKVEVHAVVGYFDILALERSALIRVLPQNGIGVVDVNENLAGRLQRPQRFNHASFARLGQVSHVQRALLADAQIDHFIVGPAGAVDEQAVGLLHERHDVRLDGSQAWCVEQLSAGADIFQLDAQIVALVRVMTVGRIGGRLAGQGDRGDPDARHALNLEAVSLRGGNPMPIDATEVPKNVEDRITLSQILMDHVGTVDIQGGLALTQHEQPCGVVDLRIHQPHGAHGSVAYGTARLQFGKVDELCEDVRRGIEQQPVHVVAAHCDGGLGSSRRLDGALAQAIAIGAVAVPLGKSAACGRTQYSYPHSSGVSLRVIGIDGC